MLPKNHRDLYRRTIILGELCVHESDAARLTYTVLDMWLTSKYPNLVTGLGCELFKSNLGVEDFAVALTELPFIEAAFWLSCGYALWVGSETRKSKAMFFTPPKLAERVIATLIQQGASLESDRWFDPACGGAAFIAPLAVGMRAKLLEVGSSPNVVLQTIERNIVGIEIDCTLQTLSMTFVRAAVYEETVLTGTTIQPKITCRDTLALGSNDLPDFDVLICNPPYRKLSVLDRSQIHAEYLTEIEGQHNLYGVFMAAAVKAAKPGTLLGLLTPTSYLSGRHFSKLRKFLADEVRILQLDMLPERDSTFVKVEQETVVLYARRAKPSTFSQAPIEVLSSADGADSLGSITFDQGGAPWYVPRSGREFAAFSKSASAPSRLRDYGYKAKIGPLVWNRDKRKKLFSELDVQNANCPVPVVWSSNITSDGNFAFARSSGQKEFFSFIELDNTTSAGLVRTACAVLQRVTSADQQKRLVGAVIPQEFLAQYGFFIAENHVITLIPVEPLISPACMVQVLMSESVDALFRCISGTVGVTVFELEQLPLPDPQRLLLEIQAGHSVSEAVARAY